jgi:Flp pilus assembly protein TadG
MRYLPAKTLRRRGTVAPLSALLVAFLVGMVAFAVDIGWIVLTRSDLQNAADSAALAGVKPLMDGYVLYNLPGANQPAVLTSALASASANAKLYASYNAAGGVKSLTLNDSDIEFGFTDGNGNYTPMAFPPLQYPNTIKVTMRRDSQANGTLGLYFGPIFGMRSTNVLASAAATMYGGTVDSFSMNPNYNLGMLPLTYDVNHWNNFLKTGLDPDGNLTLYNGNAALQVYPSIKAPGNFGQLSLDDAHIGDSTEVTWVNNGMSAADLAGLTSNKLVPLSAHDPTKWDWIGDTGMKQSLVSAINAQAGKSYLIPLFTPLDSGVPDPSTYSAGTGQGKNYFYNIVAFASVTIVPANNGTVVVQPCATINPNYVFAGGGPVPVGSGASPQFITTFAAPKLTQ